MEAMAVVRCKFKCVEVTKQVGWNGNEFVYSYKFNVVYGDTPENKTFFAATPGGSLQLCALKNDLFVVGSEYYLDLSPAN